MGSREYKNTAIITVLTPSPMNIISILIIAREGTVCITLAVDMTIPESLYLLAIKNPIGMATTLANITPYMEIRKCLKN